MAGQEEKRLVGGDAGLFGGGFAANIISGTLCGGGGPNQHTAILAEHPRPALDVAGLLRMGIWVLDAREATQEGGAKLSNKLLEGMLFDAVAFGLGETVQAAWMAGGMNQLMEQGGVIVIGALDRKSVV